MTQSERRGFSPTDTREGFFYCSLFFEHGCSEDDERNEVVVLQTPLWVFLPQWQMMKKDTHPSLLISFFTPTMTARPHKRDEALSSICTSPIIHLVCPPNILHTHCLQFLLRWLEYPAEIKNKSSAKFWGDKQGVLQEMCKCRMLFSKSGVFIYAFTK